MDMLSAMLITLFYANIQFVNKSQKTVIQLNNKGYNEEYNNNIIMTTTSLFEQEIYMTVWWV